MLVTQLLDLTIKDLKRSVHPVHYVYMFHSLISTHMADHENSFDHYDTILCAGPHQGKSRFASAKQMKGAAAEKQLDSARLLSASSNCWRSAANAPPLGHTGDDPADIHVLLAPSWGEQTILKSVRRGTRRAILLDAGFPPHPAAHIFRRAGKRPRPF